MTSSDKCQWEDMSLLSTLHCTVSSWISAAKGEDDSFHYFCGNKWAKVVPKFKYHKLFTQKICATGKQMLGENLWYALLVMVKFF